MWRVPLEVMSTATSVDAAPALEAVVVPESAVVVHCTFVVVATADPRVVVTVIRREHHAVVVAELITGVTRVSRHVKRVVTRLPKYKERTVLGVVPAEITVLDVKSQLVAAA